MNSVKFVFESSATIERLTVMDGRSNEIEITETGIDFFKRAFS